MFVLAYKLEFDISGHLVAIVSSCISEIWQKERGLLGAALLTTRRPWVFGVLSLYMKICRPTWLTDSPARYINNVNRCCKFHPTGLSSSTGMNLSFHHYWCAKLFRCGNSFFNRNGASVKRKNVSDKSLENSPRPASRTVWTDLQKKRNRCCSTLKKIFSGNSAHGSASGIQEKRVKSAFIIKT